MTETPEPAGLEGGAADGAGGQQAIVQLLSRPDSYPHEAGDMNRIETHAAIVFLAGEFAYKLKRAIKLPYLDFSTVEKRRIALQREFEINSRAAPEIYLSVLPVTRARGPQGYEIGGTGEAADWLLVMRRFDQEALLDTMASKGKLDCGHLTALADTIEHFHRQAPRMTSAGFARALDEAAANAGAALCSLAADKIGLHAAPYIGMLREQLEARTALINERERDGFVRRCHGDLHLKNIVLWQGHPTLFDAIEFDEKLATIDVLYDLAFLLMDLWHRGLRQQANLILNHCFQRAAMRELAGLALLPLFLSLRAAIRAMTAVHGLGVQQQASEPALASAIKSYAALAARLLAPGPPSLVAIGGISGTGKTSAAREAAALIGAVPGALILRTDVERKVMQGVALDSPLPRDSYAPEARDEVYRRVFKKAETVLNAGHSVIVDAVFPAQGARTLLCELAHRTNANFWGFWLEADPSIVRQRIRARSGGASDADITVAEAQLRTVMPPEGWIKVDASGPVHASAAAIMRRLWACPQPAPFEAV
jgi:aminoglycoside phosphotransferase family enzyme/predicted kinase